MRWKQNFMAYFLLLFAVKAVNHCELFIFTAFSEFLQKKESFLHGFEPLTSCMPSSYSTAPNITYCIDLSCEIKSDWVEVGKKCGDFVRNAVKCAELFLFTAFTAFTAFLTLMCHKSWCGEFLSEMRLILRSIFVRKAVKCGQIFLFTAITAFLTKIQRIHRISYKNLPKNLYPGIA